jgi:multidrug resistance efflux pump
VSQTEMRSPSPGLSHDIDWSPRPVGRPTLRGRRILPIVLTLAVVGLAVWLGDAMWNVYKVAPWTRDGTVRAYVVTVAPEVAGRIVTLPVADNQYVHKGDLLLVIDPRDYVNARDQAKGQLDLAEAELRRASIAHEVARTMFPAQLEAAEAQLGAAKANQVKADADDRRYHNLPPGATTREQVDAVTAAADDAAAMATQADAHVKEASLVQQNIAQTQDQADQAHARVEIATAKLNQAELNLARTSIPSSVNGYATNLITQLGDYATVGNNLISVVSAESFWVDGYFKETNLARIHVGDRALAKLMAYAEPLRGHVESIARGITVANAETVQSGLATVNPIYTWVRLAQRIPVRIHIDHVPEGVLLAAGETATVQIDPGPYSPTK